MDLSTITFMIGVVKKKKLKLTRRHAHIGLISLAVAGLAAYFVYGRSNERASSAGLPTAPAGKTWNLAWSDEFAGSSVDATKWNVADNSNFGASNNEDECYEAANVSVAGGALRLTAQKQTVTCGATNPDTGNNTYYFTSGLVTTRAQGGAMKFKFNQGYAEARVKAPKGDPYWPAFWLVGPQDGSTPSWPDYGEFDIFEMYGARPDVTNGALHYKCTKAGNHCQTNPTWYNIKTDSSYGGTSTLGPQVLTQAAMDAYSGGTTDYQTYGFWWEGDKISWYVNGRKYRYFDGTNVYRIEQNGSQTLETTTATLGTPSIPFSTVFAYDHSIILNLAVGGNGPKYSSYGYTGQDSAGGYSDGNYVAANPGTLEVDYVRVYQLANAATPTPATPTPATPTPATPTPTPVVPTPSSTSSPITTPTPTSSAAPLGSAPAAPSVVNPTTGETVKVAADNQLVTGNAVLSPELATSPAAQALVAKVEYYVDGKLKQTLTAPPYQFSTKSLADGTYTITEKIYNKDGTTKVSNARVQVLNYSGKKPSYQALIIAGGIAATLIALVSIPFTRRKLLGIIRYIRILRDPRSF